MRFIFDTQVEEQKYRNSTIHDGTHAGFIRQTRFMTSSVCSANCSDQTDYHSD